MTYADLTHSQAFSSAGDGVELGSLRFEFSGQMRQGGGWEILMGFKV